MLALLHRGLASFEVPRQWAHHNDYARRHQLGCRCTADPASGGRRGYARTILDAGYAQLASEFNGASKKIRATGRTGSFASQTDEFR